MARRYAIYLNEKSSPQRLGTVTAADRPAAIKKAIELYTYPKSRLEIVLLMPPKLKRVKVRAGL
jgi:hypothetical protein